MSIAPIVQDVWFQFTTDANGGMAAITVAASAPGDPLIHFYNNGCSGAGICIDANTGSGTSETLNTPGLAANTIYNFRVYGQNTATFPFTVSVTGTALPLELKSFTGKVAASTNVLSWETLTEKNVQFHLVERSADGAAWSEIGRKNGSANSSVAIKYTLEDRAPLAKAYYRLRSVDFDGEENISNTVALSRKGDQSGITSVFPSPTKHNMTVQFNATREEQVLVQIMDMTGRQVLEQSRAVITGSNDLLLVLNTLQAGIYTVKVSNSAGVSAPVRFVKE